MYGIAIDRDHASDEVTEIDPELTRRGAIDDPETDPAAALDAHDLRIVKRAIIGEEGVE